MRRAPGVRSRAALRYARARPAAACTKHQPRGRSRRFAARVFAVRQCAPLEETKAELRRAPGAVTLGLDALEAAACAERAAAAPEAGAAGASSVQTPDEPAETFGTVTVLRGKRSRRTPLAKFHNLLQARGARGAARR